MDIIDIFQTQNTANGQLVSPTWLVKWMKWTMDDKLSYK